MKKFLLTVLLSFLGVAPLFAQNTGPVPTSFEVLDDNDEQALLAVEDVQDWIADSAAIRSALIAALEALQLTDSVRTQQALDRVD
ncbi:hypothetical protein LCGC14_2956460, partial [marine sediment metagenome]